MTMNSLTISILFLGAAAIVAIATRNPVLGVGVLLIGAIGAFAYQILKDDEVKSE